MIESPYLTCDEAAARIAALELKVEQLANLGRNVIPLAIEMLACAHGNGLSFQEFRDNEKLLRQVLETLDEVQRR